MTRHAIPPATVTPPTLVDVSWRSWPLRDAAPASALAVAAVAGAGLLVEWRTGSPWGIVAAVLLMLGSRRFWVPVRFEVNGQGIHQRAFGRSWSIPWNAVRGYEVYRRGVLLLPARRPLPLDALRGLFLPWGIHRDQVLAWVESRVS